MLAKISMCSCNVGEFHREENEYIKKICHFYCHCRDEHETFVYTCKAHAFIATRVEGMDFQHRCEKRDSSQVCDFCIQVKYLLNFRAYKICLKKIPEKFQQHLVSLDKYLEEMNFCEPFFILMVKRLLSRSIIPLKHI